MTVRYLYAIIFGLLFNFPLSAFADSSCKAQDSELHHIFPRQYEMYFKKHDIDIDLYTILLPIEIHRNLHHKNNYNQKWGEYIAANAESSREAIFGFSALLLLRSGIKDAVFCNYKTKAPTGEKYDVLDHAKQQAKKLPQNKEGMFSKKNKEIIEKTLANSGLYGSICGIFGGIGGAIAGGSVGFVPGAAAGAATGGSLAFAKCAALAAAATLASIYIDEWLADPESLDPTISYFTGGLALSTEEINQ